MKILYVGPNVIDPEAGRKFSILEKIARHFEVLIVYAPGGDYDLSTSSLIDEMRSCSCLIADLSCERPSVYYEVGLAVGLGVVVRLVVQNNTVIHQVPKEIDIDFFEGVNEFEMVVMKVVDQMIRSLR